MKNQIKISLNTKSPIQKDLEIKLQGLLSSFQAVEFKTDRVEPEAGTLAGMDVVQFIVESGPDLVKIVAAIIMAYQQIKGPKKPSNPTKKELVEDKIIDMTIDVNDNSLELPASSNRVKSYTNTLDGREKKITKRSDKTKKKASKLKSVQKKRNRKKPNG